MEALGTELFEKRTGALPLRAIGDQLRQGVFQLLQLSDLRLNPHMIWPSQSRRPYPVSSLAGDLPDQAAFGEEDQVTLHGCA